MSLTDLISSAVATANRVTSSLQDQTVIHKAWIGSSGSGDASYADPVVRPALVDMSSKPTFTSSGEMVDSKATVTFLTPIPDTPPEDGQIRVQPIDPRDIIVLPDGTTGPLVRINGFVNASTHRPFMSSVTLGKG